MAGPTDFGLMNLASLTFATLVELREFFADVDSDNRELRQDVAAWIRAIDDELDLRGL